MRLVLQLLPSSYTPPSLPYCRLLNRDLWLYPRKVDWLGWGGIDYVASVMIHTASLKKSIVNPAIHDGVSNRNRR